MKNKIEQIKTDKKFSFRIALIMLVLVSFLREFDYGIRSMNMSLFALSYEYGFISRGVLGTLLDFICKIGGDHLYNHTTIFMITMAGLVCYFACLIYVAEKLLKVTDYDDRVMIFILMVTPLLSRMFLTSGSNLGRTDMYLIILSIIACVLIIKKKLIFLVIPITALGMMIHQGYIFMYFNIVFAMLLYHIYEERVKNGKKGIYSITVLVISSLTVLGLLFWFEIFRHRFLPLGEDVLNQVIERAKLLQLHENDYNEGFLRHEILGEQTLGNEWKIILTEVFEFLVFLVMSAPLFVIIKKFIKKLFTYIEDKKYCIILMCGSLSILPLMILKCDYGRWIFSVFVYYILLISFSIIKGNKAVLKALQDVTEELKSSWFGIFCAIYFVTFLPFKDVVISKITSRIALGIIMVIEKLFIG